MSSFSLGRIKRRSIYFWRTMFTLEDLSTLLVIGVLLLMPALALDASEWPLALRTLIPVLVMSVIFGFMLARSRYNELLALIVCSLYGIVIVFFVTAVNEPGNILEGFAAVLVRSFEWFQDALTGGINQDNLVFTLLVSVLFWYLGYNSLWHTFRLDRLWRVLLPPGLIIVANMVVYSGTNPLEIYLVIYLFAALLLIVRATLRAREWDWYVSGIRIPKRIQLHFFWAGAVLTLVALLVAWAIPSSNVQERLDRFQDFLQSDPLVQMSEFWNRLFSPIESDGPPTTDYYGGDSLNLGGAIRLGEQVVLLVDVPDTSRRYYWRSRVFEVYEAGQWSPSATTRVTIPNPPISIDMDEEIIGQARVPVEQEITLGLTSSRILYTAPQPLQVNMSGRLDVLYTDGENKSLMNVSVIRPRQVLERGSTYTATSLMSVATAHDLRRAGTNYPQWVINPNLYIGMSVSPRVAALAQQIVDEAGAFTPYDRAKAVERWLRQNITYNETIAAPPPDRDPVEWILFETRQGYCTYYATSMIVMLRSLGIPARMAAGFAQGEFDFESGEHVVRERDAHTWVEVYFPGYGWIEFEPTAAQMPLDREGDDTIINVPEPVLPDATATPTATPTPIPSPTPQTTNDPAQPPPNQSQPTVTLTPSPTVTATPVIVPTVAPPIEPQQSGDFLSFLLPAVLLAILALLSLLAVVLILVFIYWWWEWRGLGGLSPVSRAYARLERYIHLIGIRTSSRQTPHEKRRQIVKKLPSAKRPVDAITKLYTEERYSSGQQHPTDGARYAQVAEKAWPDARRNIIKRWLRRFVPFLRE